MASQIHIAPEGARGSSGPPPSEDDPFFGGVAARAQVLLPLAFGIALGLACMLMYWLVPLIGHPTGGVARFFQQVNPNLWLSFLFGFIAGVLIAGVYNLLAVRRLNIFGMESRAD